MDVSDLLAKESHLPGNGPVGYAPPRPNHTYPTRHASSSYGTQLYMPPLSEVLQNTPDLNYPRYIGGLAKSPMEKPPKTVNFQLILSESPHHKARLPLRVHIQAHDSTESIITTVKNFYGLYEGQGVSFEHSDGVTLIAQYENLGHNTTIHVRITSEHSEVFDAYNRQGHTSYSPQRPRLDEAFQMPPPQPYSRPHSRAAKKRSVSPTTGMGRRSASARAQSKLKARNGPAEEMDGAANGLSDSDAGSVSVSSSRRAKSDQVASAEISLDNILEGGRRKRAKFESSELPLFAPPQQPMSASISSLSPQRRFTNSNVHSPMSYNNQYNFMWNHSLPSPQSNAHGESGFIHNAAGMDKQGNYGHRLRARASSGPAPTRLPVGNVPRVLPTPDPTIGSVISDEDVALQLMRLGDASNLSLGRTSTSTMDDALSGKAEAASSGDDTDDGSGTDEDLPHYMSKKHHYLAGHARKKQKIEENALPVFESGETSCDDSDDQFDGPLKEEHDGLLEDGLVQSVERIKTKTKANKMHTSNGSKGHTKSRTSISKSKNKASATSRIPPSPYSIPGPVRHGSQSSLNIQHQLVTDEDDLSSKPRCQRCRKSKKGCDRQRPCQRCKDAGIGVEGCISEDEGNGRKGRYGRHMGVPVKRDSNESIDSAEEMLLDAEEYSPERQLMDGSRKRKR